VVQFGYGATKIPPIAGRNAVAKQIAVDGSFLPESEQESSDTPPLLFYG
jgi:hypothetical protein